MPYSGHDPPPVGLVAAISRFKPLALNGALPTTRPVGPLTCVALPPILLTVQSGSSYLFLRRTINTESCYDRAREREENYRGQERHRQARSFSQDRQCKAADDLA
jgi:hypothetical protein